MEEKQESFSTSQNQHSTPQLTQDQRSFPQSDLRRDLGLAAQLGRELLDRNNELEKALEKSQRDVEEKDFEVKLLLQRISELNELTQRKCMLADEAELNSTELCQLNRLLTAEMEADKRKINRLSARIVELERQVNDLWDRVEGCTCYSSQHSRSQSKRTVEKSVRCALRSLSPSPTLASNVKEGIIRTSSRRRCSTAIRCLFIDDELIDQPLLGTCVDKPSFFDEKQSDNCVHEKSLHSNSRIYAYRRTRSFTRSPVQRDVFNSSPSSRKRSTYPERFTSSLVSDPSSVIIQSNRETLPTSQPINLQSSGCAHHLEAVTNTGGKGLFTEDDPLNRSETCYHMNPDIRLFEDYQPQYKQIFRDVFFLLRAVKSFKDLPFENTFSLGSSHSDIA